MYALEEIVSPLSVPSDVLLEVDGPRSGSAISFIVGRFSGVGLRVARGVGGVIAGGVSLMVRLRKLLGLAVTPKSFLLRISGEVAVELDLRKSDAARTEGGTRLSRSDPVDDESIESIELAAP